MKRLILMLLVLGSTILSYGINDSAIPYAPQSVSEPVKGSNFKLYPTYNYWTFLELDTRYGKVWRVQFTIQGDNYRFKILMFSENLLREGDEVIPGRFTLYPTNNYHNFILLDQINGRCWQLQYGDKAEDLKLIQIGD